MNNLSEYRLLEYLRDIGNINRCDQTLVEKKLGVIADIIQKMSPDDRLNAYTILCKRLNSLRRVKCDLTKPTRPGGFDIARFNLINYEILFERVIDLLKV